MRKFNKNDIKDINKKEILNADDWQIDLLKLNPNYVNWGPGEGYMYKHKDSGHESSLFFKKWKEHNVVLDELNELVNFYFSIERESEKCEICNGTGYHQDALWVVDSFEQHTSPFKIKNYKNKQIYDLMKNFSEYNDEELNNSLNIDKKNFPDEETLNKYHPDFRKFCEEMAYGEYSYWYNNITEDEAEELVKEKRGHQYRLFKASDFNEATKKPGFIVHDSINKNIILKQRLKRFGIPIHCEKCNGKGYVFTKEKPYVNLTYWLIHPMKGASRGVKIKEIEREEIHEVLSFLKEAGERNKKRFEKIEKISNELNNEIYDLDFNFFKKR